MRADPDPPPTFWYGLDEASSRAGALTQVASMLDAMTPQQIKSKVGIRELHDQLSRYVRHVREGGEVVVTMHGKAVARLTPIEDRPDPLADLRARGLVTEPARPKRPIDPGALVQASGSVSELVRDQRR